MSRKKKRRKKTEPKPAPAQTPKQESQTRPSIVSRTLQAQRELASIFYLSMVLLYLFTHLEETGERLNRLPWWSVSLFLLLNFSWTALWIAAGERWKSNGKLDYYRANLQGVAIALPYLLAIQYATGLSDRLVELMQGWLPNLSSSAVKWLSRILEWSVSGAIGNAFWEFLKSRWKLGRTAKASRRR